MSATATDWGCLPKPHTHTHTHYDRQRAHLFFPQHFGAIKHIHKQARFPWPRFHGGHEVPWHAHKVESHATPEAAHGCKHHAQGDGDAAPGGP